MKNMVLVLLALTLNSWAYAENVEEVDNSQVRDAKQVCKLVHGPGEVQSFTVTYKVDGDALVSRKAGFEFIQDSGYDYLEKLSSEVELRNAVGLSDIEFYYESDGDWAGAMIGIMSRDDGASAVVNFRSDGPNSVSFYECDAIPFEL